MRDFPIGVLDSGIGGASILKEVIKQLPNEKFVYLADTKNLPYGNKTSKKILKIVKKNVLFLIAKYKIKMLLIACNTASSVCLSRLRKEFSIPMVGIEPAIKPAVECGYKKIVILATKRTLRSNATIKENIKAIKIKNKKKDKENRVIIIKKSIKNLATQVDKYCNNFEKVQPLLDQKLRKFKNFEILAIGCTHFNFIKKEIQKSLPYTKLISCEKPIAKRTIYLLKQKNLMSESVENHKPIIILTRPNFRIKNFLESYLKNDSRVKINV